MPLSCLVVQPVFFRGSLQTRLSSLHGVIQFHVFGLGFAENPNIRIRIFPKGQEFPIFGEALVIVSGDSISASQSEVRQGTKDPDRDSAGIIKNLLELGCGFVSRMQFQVGKRPANTWWHGRGYSWDC